ncbi:hypothetical protein BTJ40_09720 [Microbulbifer sp. A4B17]|nr:hypothetical protein BTJ40_09720 [Microbulbifer sp. A4B17]
MEFQADFQLPVSAFLIVVLFMPDEEERASAGDEIYVSASPFLKGRAILYQRHLNYLIFPVAANDRLCFLVPPQKILQPREFYQCDHTGAVQLIHLILPTGRCFLWRRWGF